MSFVGAIHNPLAINLQRQLSLLLPHIPSNTTHYLALARSTSTPQTLSALSSLLAVPAFTKLVSNLFRPILLDLCSRWIDNDADVEEHLFALCYLLEVHTELFPCVNSVILCLPDLIFAAESSAACLPKTSKRALFRFSPELLLPIPSTLRAFNASFYHIIASSARTLNFLAYYHGP